MDTIYSKMLKAGSITYFMDVREAKNNKKYLTVTASQLTKDGDRKFRKRSVTIFSDVADSFIKTLKEAKDNIDGEGEFSKRVKTGRISYFIDVKDAKNKSRFVSITESQPSKDEPSKYSKRSITVFDNSANDFVRAIEEAIGYLK